MMQTKFLGGTTHKSLIIFFSKSFNREMTNVFLYKLFSIIIRLYRAFY